MGCGLPEKWLPFLKVYVLMSLLKIVYSEGVFSNAKSNELVFVIEKNSSTHFFHSADKETVDFLNFPLATKATEMKTPLQNICTKCETGKHIKVISKSFWHPKFSIIKR